MYNTDAALVFMLAERFKITQAVGRYKASHGLPPADGAREKAQVERLRSLAKSANLDPEFSEQFLRFIIDDVDRKSVVLGKSVSARVDLGGRRIIKDKKCLEQ